MNTEEDAARLLLSCGFRPSDTVGQVRHTEAPYRSGLTLGSIWREMRKLAQGTPVTAANKEDEASRTGTLE